MSTIRRTLLAWEQVAQRLLDARNYWLCTVRPDGRPHVVPLWAVWQDEQIFFDGSPETRHAQKYRRQPAAFPSTWKAATRR